MMKNNGFDLQQKVSNQVAFSAILIVGVLVAWFTIKIGQKIITGFPENNLKEAQKSYELSGEDAPPPIKTLKK